MARLKQAWAAPAKGVLGGVSDTQDEDRTTAFISSLRATVFPNVTFPWKMPTAACEPFVVFVPLIRCEPGNGVGGAVDIDIVAEGQGSLSHRVKLTSNFTRKGFWNMRDP